MDLCSRFRTTKSRCAACADVCPVEGTLRLSEHGAEVGDTCVECGVCVSACPNGVFRPRETDADLAAQIRAAAKEKATFRIACGRADTVADLVIPCLARMTEALLLEPLRNGVERIEIAAPDCVSCAWAKTLPQTGRMIESARVILEALGLDPERIQRVRTSFNSRGSITSVRHRREAQVSRREVLHTVARGAVGVAAASLAPLGPGKQGDDLFRDRIQNHPENPKRSHLLQALRGLAPDESAWRVKGPPTPFASLEIGPKCIGCNVCETLCPTGAIHRSESEGIFTLAFEADKCTACGVCEEACFPKAIRMRREFNPSRVLNGRTEALISSPRRLCRACGGGFLGKAGDFCPMCLALSKRQQAAALRWFEGERPHAV